MSHLIIVASSLLSSSARELSALYSRILGQAHVHCGRLRSMHSEMGAVKANYSETQTVWKNVLFGQDLFIW